MAKDLPIEERGYVFFNAPYIDIIIAFNHREIIALWLSLGPIVPSFCATNLDFLVRLCTQNKSP